MFKRALVASTLPLLVAGCLGAGADSASEDVLPSELALASGTYNFGTSANPGACLDVAGDATGDGVNIQEWWCTGSESQSFRLDDLGGGWWHIVNTHSNRCLDAAWNATADGTNIAQATCSNSGAQAWRFEDVGNGKVRIIGQTSNKCVDVAGAGKANGTNVQLWSCNGSNAQAWSAALISGGGSGSGNGSGSGSGSGSGPSLAGGTYNFGTVANPGACLDVAGAGTGDGVNVQEWWCTGSNSQSFRVDDLGGGWSHIVNTNSNKCLDVAWDATADGTNIAQVTCSTSGAQAFRFEDVGNGKVKIVGKTSNKCVDVAGSGKANGTNVQLWSCNGTNAQAWNPAMVSGGGSGSGSGSGGSTGGGSGGGAGWKLIWADEFNGPNGSGVDGSKWTAEVGGSGWGNQELEYYTNSTQNAQQQNGSLVITATPAGANQYNCWYGTCQYTSARLVTKGKFEFTYGRAESRVKIPRGQGLWPAFWMLGNDIGSAGWPTCGEVDIMENIGKEPVTNHGSMHGPGYSGGNPLTGIYNNPGGALGDDFHTYAMEWEPAAVRFYVDGNLYETRTPANLPGGTKWVYDHNFFMLLNLAVGGNWPGSPDGSTGFPKQMVVDYVRVYKAGT